MYENHTLVVRTQVREQIMHSMSSKPYVNLKFNDAKEGPRARVFEIRTQMHTELLAN